MPVLRLTSKLLAEIDDSPSSESESLSPSPIGDWYGHLFTIDRRKCILFINEPTLFACLACWVAKSHYRRIVPFFKEILTWTLRDHLFSEDEIRLLLGLHEDIAIGRPQNRSTVGSLNNRARNAKIMVQWHGGYGNCDFGAVNLLLNGTPMKPIGYSNGEKEMRILVGRLMKSCDVQLPVQTSLDG